MKLLIKIGGNKMATVYDINIKTVSAFCAYNEKDIKEIFEKLIKEYKDKKTNLGFENTEISVKIMK